MNITPVLKLWDSLAGSEAGRPGETQMANRYRGALLGVAVGNLLGIPAEGMPKSSLLAYYPLGIKDIDPRERDMPWDDDLAQTVILAEALLNHDNLNIEDLSTRLVRWARENGRGMGNLTWRVIQELDRGTSATDAARRVWELDGRQPAGNGAVMRCSPVALRWRLNPEHLVKETLRSAQVTHYDPRCQWSAVALTIALSLALEQKELDLEALAEALNKAGAPASVPEAIRFVEGRSLEELDLDDPHAMGYTLKAMQVGLWAITQGSDFEETLVSVINACGDTDTNGAVAGAVLGGIHGSTAIPQRWLECIANRDNLERLADELHIVSKGIG